MKLGKFWDRVTTIAAKVLFWSIVVFGTVLIFSLTACNRGYGCPNAF